ncbi:MAG: ABC transporter substrate-binding protein, partial [Rhodospirillales bacterium]
NRDLLTGAAVENGLPVFAAGEAPVRTSNALFGVVNRYYNVGQLTAHKARAILVDGADPKDIAIDSPARLSLIVNMKVARALNAFPPMGILTFAEVIDDAAAKN